MDFLLSLKEIFAPELTSNLLAAIALIISVLTWIRQGVQSKLHRAQLDELKKQLVRADVRVILRRLEAADNDNKWCFVVENHGQATARNVRFEIESLKGTVSPLDERETRDKLPVEKLRPGDQIQLTANVSYDTGSTFQACWKWHDEDNQNRSRQDKFIA